MRAGVVRAGVVMAVALSLGGCRAGSQGRPPVVRASEPAPSATASDGREARLVALRATDQFDEFAEHERAAQADGARLAWENFAPIVDGERVEWANKAELWDAIAPRIRDEALLLGPEYRKPLWDNTNAIPNSVAAVWNEEDTHGRGHYFEFLATYSGTEVPAERIWGFLVRREADGSGRLLASRPAQDFRESEFESITEQDEAASSAAWTWVEAQKAD